MTAFEKVAEALVPAGYLSDVDVDRAAAVRADVLVVKDAEGAVDAALQDEEYQEDVIADAAGLAQDDAWDGDLQDAAYQQDRIAGAEAQAAIDEQIISAGQDSVTAVYADAAAALLAAELIDAASVDGAAAVITDFWVVS